MPRLLTPRMHVQLDDSRPAAAEERQPSASFLGGAILSLRSGAGSGVTRGQPAWRAIAIVDESATDPRARG